MSGKLRTDNECENCGYTVDIAYCSKCGQKNVETRQTFPKLVGHFAEDLTHYDTAFWRTLRDILLRPGRVTRTYLEGKRQKYVPPVKLYIFVSFITFFLIAILPDHHYEEKHHEETIGSAYGNSATQNTESDETEIFIFEKHYTTAEQAKKDYEKGEIPYVVYKFVAALIEHKDATDEQIIDSIIHTIPKALFLYMPLFAFWIWLFHGKKRWYFFDHGIFTLYYFSFLLLLITIINIIVCLSGYIFNADVTDEINGWLIFIGLIYSFFYFFRAHRRMYGESRLVSRLKSFTLFIINMICMSIAMILIFYFAFISMH